MNPDANKITVLANGNSKGSIASIPIGGHIAPNSIVGESALWKNVQNIATKNNASETMNSATPMFNPRWTAKVWFPSYVPSAIISRNQNAIDNTKHIILKTKMLPALKNPWKDNTEEVVTFNNDNDEYKGHGDGETKWKGCAWKLLLLILTMVH